MIEAEKVKGQLEAEQAKEITKILGAMPECLYSERKKHLPKSCGFYFLFSGNLCLYAGQSTNIWHRWFNHHIIRKVDREHRDSLIIKWLPYSPVEGASVFGIERHIIRMMSPLLNKQESWDVLNFNGVRLTWRESLAFNNQREMAASVGVSVAKLRHAMSEVRAKFSSEITASVSEKLRSLIGSGTSKQWASENGLSQATVSRILNRNRRAGAKVLKTIGIDPSNSGGSTDHVNKTITRPEWI